MQVVDEVFAKIYFSFDSSKNDFSHSHQSSKFFRGLDYSLTLFFERITSFRRKNEIVNLPVRKYSYNSAVFPPCLVPASPMFTEASIKLMVNNACKSRKWARVIPEHLSWAFGCIRNMLLNRLQQSVSNNGRNNGESFFDCGVFIDFWRSRVQIGKQI